MPTTGFAQPQQLTALDGPLAHVRPVELFGGLSSEAWRWLHFEGREQCPFLADYLPGTPGDAGLEAQFVGLSGREALAEGFDAYELFIELHAKYAGRLAPEMRVLDFGCGWGRIIRYFLKDVAPENLVGIDSYPQAITLSAQTNHWCSFQRCNVLPPTALETDSFDLIYAFSVFSHLSEQAHLRWLEEFQRLLRPDGVLILTTFRREYLDESLGGASDADKSVPLEQWLARYDEDNFCFRRLAAVPSPHFGDAFIPEGYVRRRWASLFDVREYLDAPRFGQKIIVCTGA